MSRTMRRRLLQTVELMGQAIQAVDSMLQNRQYEESLTLLSDCQELAVALGTKIEQIRGMGTETVAALEQFCEALYQAGLEISDVENNLQTLRQQWKTVENAFDQDVPDKKEVVFLPYKASMWDSLESVYLAAREDPECEAYCVPIPYYDKDSDGSFGEMHYEGDEFPKDIEVTDWQQYNLEEWLPDEIYIHNPYDEFNLVTSVHPGYYAKNLKQYTEELVYIPYFVMGEIEPDDQVSIDKMKHFIWTPGVIYADKVIVQSEKMKQIYVNEYLQAAELNGMGGIHQNREYLEKKILGLGSPKVDKVLRTKKEDLDIPEDWLRIIEKPDGSWKKIIFYNIGVSTLLEYNEEWVEKIEDVLKVFKENCAEIALLWRPHPLLEKTMETMRPEILRKYLEIKKNYLNEAWGIYDDTTDLNRAITLSDAYYGDKSSVVELYRKTGKRILIQKPDVIGKLNEEELRTLPASCLVYEDGVIYFAFGSFLFKMDWETGKTDCLCNFAGEKEEWGHCYRGMIKVDEKIILAPYSADDIVIYSLRTNQFQKISVPRLKGIGKWRWCAKFENVVRWKDKLCFIPAEYPAFALMDIKSKQMDLIPWHEKLYTDYGLNKEDQPFICLDHVIIENSIWTAIGVVNWTAIGVVNEKTFLVEIDLVNSQIIYHKNFKEYKYFLTISYKDGGLWLTEAREGVLYEYDLVRDDFVVHTVELGIPKDRTFTSFLRSYVYGDHLVFVPARHPKLLIYSDELKTVDLSAKRTASRMNNGYDDAVAGTCFRDQDMVYIAAGDNSIIRYDLQIGNMEERKMQLSEDFIEKHRMLCRQEENVFLETVFTNSLNTLMEKEK